MDKGQNKESRDGLFPELDEITNEVFLGNEDGQRDLNVLKNLGITNVLVCGSELRIFHPNDLSYLQLEMHGAPDEDLKKYIPNCFEFIEKSEKTFIHCAGGKSRSASIVIGYLMYKKKISYEEAYNLVKEKRKKINPNENFVKQLKNMEKDFL
jgi:protein-tyrosine phosphatase